ncbi:arginyl-tRNA-protein transferase [Pokkaliibacter plantistimulans]|uniref:Aspartate/glutamate leucyltransferase n=1 Tax=Pokkaliibacter plantistimulans TaxID=1635171 RepID=A0ABX5M3Q6_9GAMM|nr:arginyltransferase [Pokkaliibacter plantistimulans]PXF32298.1 arginyl-tRNA-protein transferase [Pokkaliibacter plantistimulans]
MQLERMRFYATPEHECSYLPGQHSKTLFVDPDLIITKDTYSSLSDLGFRRSGKHLYRPHCDHCSACISVRVPASEFNPTKRQRRVYRKNSGLTARVLNAQYSEEHYLLYQNYINGKHADGDMYPPSVEQYRSFLVDGRPETQFVEFRQGEQLIMVSVVDKLDHGLSAIYTFYDPESKASLGVYSILWQIERAKALNMPYVYLGYWIKSCRKMSYKLEYRPLQLLLDGQWLQCN